LIEAFGPEKLYWDQATSPVLTRNDVVVARMHGGDSWLAAFNKTDGRMHWKVERNYQTPVEGDHAYTTPLLIEQQEKQCILVWGAEHLTTYDATDGRVLWTCGDFNPHAFPNVPAVASTVIGRNVVVVASGRADRGKPTLYGIKLGGSGDVTTTHRVWKREDTGTFVPTPAEYRGSVYVLRDRGEVECLSPATGKTIWKDGFPRASANFYASPLIAGENLYAAREDGAVFVAKINESFKIISTNYLGEHVIASPVAVSNRLFLRGSRHLFCFAPP
jgi:outer membrane protein assembly factor BamB